MPVTSSAAGTSAAAAPRTDRVYPLVRLVAVLVIGVLALAVLVLYVFPDQTDQNFAWTIRPRMSAMLIGAGYMMGIVFFGRVATSAHWHRVSGGFLPITGFCVAMLAATLLHLDRFHSGTLQFWMWAIIYAITPLLVPGLWLWNRREDDGASEPNDAVAPRMARVIAGVAGVLVGLAGVAFFAAPDLAIGLWPWTLTPLLARIFGGWMMLPAIGGLALARESRWSVWRVLVESVTVGIVAALLATFIAWSDFDPARITTWAFVVLAVGALAAALGFRIAMDRQRG